MSTHANAPLTPEGRRRLWGVGKNAVTSRNRAAVARAKGRLRGKQPKLSAKQQTELRRMHTTGDYSIADLADQPKPEDIAADPGTHIARPKTQQIDVAALTRAKLRRLLATLDELTPLTWREGPLTVLEGFVEHTGLVLDLVAADTLESKRMVANIASFLRFAADWQQEHPAGSLAGFVDYLDAYQTAGGDLPTSVELTEDGEGVRLMTLYQAKGLEFPIVFVPQLLRDEWPAREYGSGLFPKDLLRESIPAGDIHTEEERRLLYVALTRARDRLIVTTHGGPSAKKEPSQFIEELLAGAGDELRHVDRVGDRGKDGAVPAADPFAELRRVMPIPTAREGRLSLRLQAVELLGMLEGTSATHPEAPAARAKHPCGHLRHVPVSHDI